MTSHNIGTLNALWDTQCTVSDFCFEQPSQLSPFPLEKSGPGVLCSPDLQMALLQLICPVL